MYKLYTVHIHYYTGVWFTYSWANISCFDSRQVHVCCQVAQLNQERFRAEIFIDPIRNTFSSRYTHPTVHHCMRRRPA